MSQGSSKLDRSTLIICAYLGYQVLTGFIALGALGVAGFLLFSNEYILSLIALAMSTLLAVMCSTLPYAVEKLDDGS